MISHTEQRERIQIIPIFPFLPKTSAAFARTANRIIVLCCFLCYIYFMIAIYNKTSKEKI